MPARSILSSLTLPGRSMTALYDLALIVELLESYILSHRFDSFLRDSAVSQTGIEKLRLVESATALVSLELRLQLPEVPWAFFLGLEKFVMARWFDQTPATAWSIVQRRLGPALALILRYLQRARHCSAFGDFYPSTSGKKLP